MRPTRQKNIWQKRQIYGALRFLFPLSARNGQFFKEEIIQKRIMLRRKRDGLLAGSYIVEQAA